MTRRPWRVFVRNIGPSFSFATEARAHERARDLTHNPDGERYAEVLVYDAFALPIRRTIYRHDSPEVRREVLHKGQWIPERTTQVTTYPEDLHRPHHDGRCDYCKATGERFVEPATVGALAGQSWLVGPAACDAHADRLDYRLSALERWSVVDGLARETADIVAGFWPLGSLVVEAGTRRVGMVTAHGPRQLRVLLPRTGEVVIDLDDVERMPAPTPDLRDVVASGAGRRARPERGGA